MNLEKIFGDPGLKRVYKVIFIIALIFFFCVDFWVERHHIYFFWDNFKGFNAIFGLIGASIVIVFSKVIVQWFISKKEDYYDR